MKSVIYYNNIKTIQLTKVGKEKNECKLQEISIALVKVLLKQDADS